ncbi:MAG: hypothetical protein ABFS46_12545 [Myxococcota bacterium]
MSDPFRVRPSPVALSLGALGALFVVGYPVAAARALEVWGPRSVGAVVLALGSASYALIPRSLPGPASWLRGLPLALPALAVLTGEVRFLQLVPAAILAILCTVFLASLRGGGSILKDAASALEPHAPEFIGPYCRKATLAYAALFAAQAAALVAVALSPPRQGWVLASSLLVWLPTLAGTAVEFLVRKAWFRNFGRGPLDQVLRRLLPPERTAQGRRSLAYIREKRSELGMPPP